jgi:glucosamine--fructose-6-phosphate aminotransferase (isomerizing)
MTRSPFELDIDDQADALLAFAQSTPPDGLEAILPGQHERIVLTGMGSSHYAALPTWRRLVACGYRSWWVDTGQLLDTPRLITPDTLLIATSQSGGSAEITALLDNGANVTKPRTTIGITNDPNSRLGTLADIVVALCSGDEATVSTKSYLNTLAAHQRLGAAITGSHADTPAFDAAKFVEHFTPSDVLARLARKKTRADNGRVVFVGNQDHAATALYAGLITKEAAKVPAEGFIGGQFRHGPLELAGPGLTAVLFGIHASDTNSSLQQLAAELIASRADVLLVGDLTLDGADTIVIPAGDTLTELAGGALVAQHFAVELAKARGIEPGTFTYGRKITTAL